MRKIWLTVVLICALTLSSCGKSDDYGQKLVGAWYNEGSLTPAFILYEDGTCEIEGEYGEGTWKVDKNKQLILQNYYGEIEKATIISIENGHLSIEDGTESMLLYNEPTNMDDSSNVTLEEINDNIEKEEMADTDIEVTEETLASDKFVFYNVNQDEELKDKSILCRYRTLNGDGYECLGIGIINDELQFIPCELEDSDGHSRASYSVFSEGYAYINYVIDTEVDHFVIIDIDGNVVYESPNDAMYEILCGGNGYYYVKKKISGFDTNEVSYWIVSVDGVWTAVDFVTDTEASDYRYNGSGVLQLGNTIFVKMDNCSIYHTFSKDKYWPEFVGFTENNELIWLHSSSYAGEVYVTDINGNTRQIAVTGRWGKAKYGDGLIFVSDSQGDECYNARYIDLEGNVIIDLSQYKIVNFKTGEQFYNGYAALQITGQDYNHYLAIIDKNGNFAFEPIQFSTYSNFCGIGTFSNGYIPVYENTYIAIVDCKGNIAKVSLETDDLKNLICADDLIFDKSKVKFYDMTGKECSISMGN